MSAVRYRGVVAILSGVYSLIDNLINFNIKTVFRAVFVACGVCLNGLNGYNIVIKQLSVLKFSNTKLFVYKIITKNGV